MRFCLLALTLLAGCAVQPFTVAPLTLSSGPAYVAPGPVPLSMQSHIRLPSCGQCHR